MIALTGGIIVARTVFAWAAAASPALSVAGLVHDRPGLLSAAMLAESSSSRRTPPLSPACASSMKSAAR